MERISGGREESVADVRGLCIIVGERRDGDERAPARTGCEGRRLMRGVCERERKKGCRLNTLMLSISVRDGRHLQ